jgi:rare lipoprotein A
VQIRLRDCRSGHALVAVALSVWLVACASPVNSPPGPTPTPERSAGKQRDAQPLVFAASTANGLAQGAAGATAAAPESVAKEPAAITGTAVTEASLAATSSVQPFAQGMASWYGSKFHGRRTANGERYDMHGFTAAHKTLPFGTRVRVRSVLTGQEVVVRINDRGPYKRNRIIDLSFGAVTALGVRHKGVTEVVLLRE